MNARGEQPLPVTVLSGYLGAGKTTLVNHLLRHAEGRRIAVAVNEFGSLPIDSDLIEGADGNVLTLAGGCICCTFGSDLVAGLMELAERRETLDHIIIEASGVAMPDAIGQSISLVAGLSLDATVVMVDAETVRGRAAEFYMGDTIHRQLMAADFVVLNKTDLVPVESADAVEAWLKLVAQQAYVVRAEQAAVEAAVLLGSDETRARNGVEAGRSPRVAQASVGHVTAGYASANLAVDHSVDAALLGAALADPRVGLVRAKGFVHDANHGWTTLQLVGTRVTLTPMPSGAERRGAAGMHCAWSPTGCRRARGCRPCGACGCHEFCFLGEVQ